MYTKWLCKPEVSPSCPQNSAKISRNFSGALCAPAYRYKFALRACMHALPYTTVVVLASTAVPVPVAPSIPNQVQDKLSAVGLVMQAKTLALKSCSANQRWCNVRTKTTVRVPGTAVDRVEVTIAPPALLLGPAPSSKRRAPKLDKPAVHQKAGQTRGILELRHLTEGR